MDDSPPDYLALALTLLGLTLIGSALFAFDWRLAVGASGALLFYLGGIRFQESAKGDDLADLKRAAGELREEARQTREVVSRSRSREVDEP